MEMLIIHDFVVIVCHADHGHDGKKYDKDQN